MSGAEIGSAVAIIVALISGGFTYAKTRAEAGNINVAAASSVVGMVRKELERVATELDVQRRRRHELEEEVERLEHRIARLELFITEIGHDPATINGWPI